VVSKPALYSSECWTVGKAKVRRIEAPQIGFLKPLVGARGSDHVLNENIRQQLGEDCVTHEIGLYRRKWEEHTHRVAAHLRRATVGYRPRDFDGLGKRVSRK
jgi:hypothetical protein